MEAFEKKLPLLELKKEYRVLWIQLSNPKHSNAINLELVESLIGALQAGELDPEVRVIVLYGEGSNFCAGGDIKAMANRTDMFEGESNELRLKYIHGIQKIPRVMEALSKPLIAMVNGPAIGAGCDLAMMCDLRIGSEKSKFGETFVKLGLVPGDGGAFLLQRIVGYSRAMQMSLTGDIVAGKEAYEWGLLNYFVEHKDLAVETSKVAQQIAANPPIAIQMTKRAIKLAYTSDLNSILELSAAFQGIAQRTPEHFAALVGLLEKKS